MKIINLTPHNVDVILENEIRIYPSEGIARCEMEQTKIGEIDNIPLSHNSYGEVTGLPDEEKGTLYIVSLLVAQAMRYRRDDLIVVNDTVRNEKGQIVGCKGFAIV